MSAPLWERSVEVIRRTVAADLGCDVAAFDSNALTVAKRPAQVLYREYAVMVVSFGTGTVVSAEEAYIDLVEANRPRKHWHAFGATFLGKLMAGIEARGERCHAGAPSLGFGLAEEPTPAPAPPGFRLEERGRDWMEEWLPRNEFHNALGEPDERDWSDRLARAFVMFDEAGEAAAATAVADDGNGCFEIGLDVRRLWRAKRLARPLVLAAARWVLDQGALPYYTCGPANVRSHLVAERCGFRALWTVTGIARITDGVGSQED